MFWWMTGGLLPYVQGPGVGRLGRRVEHDLGLPGMAGMWSGCLRPCSLRLDGCCLPGA